jgi:glutathione synthase/RimK-type ligase-like ATP-grasp enzyme
MRAMPPATSSLSTLDTNDPAPFIGLASLMRRALNGENLSHLINMAAFNPNSANMLMGLAVIFQLTGSREVGLEMQARALALCQLYCQPAATSDALRLLVIMRPGDMMDNTQVDFLLEDFNVALDMLYVSDDLPFPESLPSHDVLLVAIAQSDENLALLGRVEALVAASSKRVINRPERIARLSRDSVSAMLQDVPGLQMPRIARVRREALLGAGRENSSMEGLLGDGGFPIIVRPIGSQAGRGLAKLENPEALRKYLDGMPDAEFYVARFVDYRSGSGLYRKYRIALIEGIPYACHMAISEDWMIHYKNAGMEASAAKRAEEESFMARFDEDFGARHCAAFHAISERLGAEYLVVDCGEINGDLLVFEADNVGFIHAMDPVDIFPYKQLAMRKAFEAFYAMLRRVARRAQ